MCVQPRTHVLPYMCMCSPTQACATIAAGSNLGGRSSFAAALHRFLGFSAAEMVSGQQRTQEIFEVQDPLPSHPGTLSCHLILVRCRLCAAPLSPWSAPLSPWYAAGCVLPHSVLGLPHSVLGTLQAVCSHSVLGRSAGQQLPLVLWCCLCVVLLQQPDLLLCRSAVCVEGCLGGCGAQVLPHLWLPPGRDAQGAGKAVQRPQLRVRGVACVIRGAGGLKGQGVC